MHVLKFNQKRMRQHLVDCFRRKELKPFFMAGSTFQGVIYCDCELPEAYDNMIERDECDQWFLLYVVWVLYHQVYEKNGKCESSS